MGVSIAAMAVAVAEPDKLQQHPCIEPQIQSDTTRRLRIPFLTGLADGRAVSIKVIVPQQV